VSGVPEALESSKDLALLTLLLLALTALSVLDGRQPRGRKRIKKAADAAFFNADLSVCHCHS
jgi:hypothetical protein